MEPVHPFLIESENASKPIVGFCAVQNRNHSRNNIDSLSVLIRSYSYFRESEGFVSATRIVW